MRWFFSFFLFYGVLQAAPLEINVRAKAALIMNADTGAVLYQKNGYTPAYPASTAKIATAAYILGEKQIDLDKMVLVSAEAVKRNPGKRTDDTPSHWLETDATIMWIGKGEKLSLRDLMHGLLLVSANDAANALAESVSGSIPKFVEELNEYVARIGCKNTHFTNPHGYHHPNQLSTPYDLCLMMKKGLELPLFREILGKPSYVRVKTNRHPGSEITQSNWLMRPAKKCYYPKAIGGKTGFHSLAGGCIITAATHEGRTLIICLLGCENRGVKFEETRRLFESLFAEKKVERLFVSGSQKFVQPLDGSKTALKASLNRHLSLSFYPSEEPAVKAYIYWNPPVLPIQKGAVVGEVRLVSEQGQIVASESLFASESVLPTFFQSLKQKWNRFF